MRRFAEWIVETRWAKSGVIYDKLQRTGFALFALRSAGVPSDDARVQRGVRWLNTNQRESGRWFTRSLVGRKANLISNSGTAWCVLALDACGEVK
jgi:squalene-hopene/tetraprenyl-beta-curcumene cyclase